MAISEPPDSDESVADGLARLESIVADSRAAPGEEAVPAEMMEVFSDEQWPRLLFEFQPSMRIFSACRDIVAVHRGAVMDGDPPAGPLRHWLVFTRGDEQLLRPLGAMECRALAMALARDDFATMATTLWPERETEGQHSAMTEMLLGWLGEGLVVDAGVPLPADAEFEER